MNSSGVATTVDGSDEVEVAGRRVSFAEQHQPNAPLLLQPSYARSKSIISDELRNFRISLKWCALDHTSCVGKMISYALFVVLAIVVPLVSSLFVRVPPSAPDDEPISFNNLVQLPESALAIIAFFTLSRFFRRYEAIDHSIYITTLFQWTLNINDSYFVLGLLLLWS